MYEMIQLHRVKTLHAQLFLCLLLVLAGSTSAFGQSDALTLSSGSTAAGSTVSLNLSLNSPAGNEPAGLQWAFSYPTASLAQISVSAGSAASAAGKSLVCAGSAGVYTCILSGINSNVIQNGVVATANLTLASTASGTVSIGVSNPQAASLTGYPIGSSSTGGTITVAAPATLSSLTCIPLTVGSGGTSACTVTLT